MPYSCGITTSASALAALYSACGATAHGTGGSQGSSGRAHAPLWHTVPTLIVAGAGRGQTSRHTSACRPRDQRLSSRARAARARGGRAARVTRRARAATSKQRRGGAGAHVERQPEVRVVDGVVLDRVVDVCAPIDRVQNRQRPAQPCVPRQRGRCDGHCKMRSVAPGTAHGARRCCTGRPEPSRGTAAHLGSWRCRSCPSSRCTASRTACATCAHITGRASQDADKHAWSKRGRGQQGLHAWQRVPGCWVGAGCKPKYRDHEP